MWSEAPSQLSSEVPAQPPPDPLFHTVEAVFPIAFGVVALLVLLGFLVVGWRLVRSGQGATSRRPSPEDVARLRAQGRQPAPAPSLEARLLELDDLRRRGVISDEEHRAARAQVLAG